MQMTGQVSAKSTAAARGNAATLAAGATERKALARGVTRTTHARTVTVVCRACDRTFSSTGSGWSHTAASGHRVDVGYSASFTFEAGAR